VMILSGDSGIRQIYKHSGIRYHEGSLANVCSGNNMLWAIAGNTLLIIIGYYFINL